MAICDSPNSLERLSVDISSIHDSKWFHLAVTGGVTPKTSLLILGYNEKLINQDN